MVEVTWEKASQGIACLMHVPLLLAGYWTRYFVPLKVKRFRAQVLAYATPLRGQKRTLVISASRGASAAM